VALALRDGVIREWSLRSTADLVRIRDDAISYCLDRAERYGTHMQSSRGQALLKPLSTAVLPVAALFRLPNNVRDQLLALAAIIIKGGWLEANAPHFGSLVADLTQLYGNTQDPAKV